MSDRQLPALLEALLKEVVLAFVHCPHPNSINHKGFCKYCGADQSSHDLLQRIEAALEGDK